MPGLGTSNEGTGHCREAGPDPRGAEMAVSPEYRHTHGKGRAFSWTPLPT